MPLKTILPYMNWKRDNFKSLGYPVGIALSLLVGLWLFNFDYNVHSSEVVFVIPGVLGFLVVIPIVLFIKSIRHLNRTTERNSIRKVGMFLIALLGIFWLSLVVAALMGDS